MRRFYYALVATYALFHLLQWWADHGAWVRRCLPAMMHVRQCTHHQVHASAGLHARCLSVRCTLFAWWLPRTVSTRSLAIISYTLATVAWTFRPTACICPTFWPQQATMAYSLATACGSRPRIKPSWDRVATSPPSRDHTRPFTKARQPTIVVLRRSNSSHSSARKGRPWKHT